ncbi:MAG: 5'-3' exonuclease [Aquificae bacterium]|nr:5'-3' exonuclease [Aquificota bacterium]
MKTLHLLDGSAFVYRSFYALPELKTSKGFPTNAVYGFMKALLSIVKKERPRYLAVAFDAPARTRRALIYERYKARRPKAPDPLKAQIPVVKELIRLAGVPVLEEPGYEADDLIASAAKRALEEGFLVRVHTPDKDLLQLVTDGLTVVNPFTGEVFTRGRVEEKFGVPPERLTDYLALTGDKTDDVPGLKGVGPKKALELLKRFGRVEEMLKRFDELRRLVPSASREELELSYELVKLDYGAPVPPPEGLEVKKARLDELVKRLEELEMKSLVKEVRLVFRTAGQGSLF